MRHLSATALICVFAFGANAKETADFDVEQWFDGCTALEQESHGSLVETVCINAADALCKLHAPNLAKENCMRDLAVHISMRAKALRAQLPNDPEPQAVSKEEYQRLLSGFDTEIMVQCDGTTLPLSMCEMASSFPGWQDMRTAKRLLSQ